MPETAFFPHKSLISTGFGSLRALKIGYLEYYSLCVGEVAISNPRGFMDPTHLIPQSLVILDLTLTTQ